MTGIPVKSPYGILSSIVTVNLSDSYGMFVLWFFEVKYDVWKMAGIPVNNELDWKMSSKKINQFIYGSVAAGVALHASTAFYQSSEGPNAFTLLLMAWSMVPYLVALLMVPMNHKVKALGFLCAILIIDVWTYFDVFVFPTKSTAAIGLLFAPLTNLIIFGPIGCLIAWFFFERKRKTT